MKNTKAKKRTGHVFYLVTPSHATESVGEGVSEILHCTPLMISNGIALNPLHPNTFVTRPTFMAGETCRPVFKFWVKTSDGTVLAPSIPILISA